MMGGDYLGTLIARASDDGKGSGPLRPTPRPRLVDRLPGEAGVERPGPGEKAHSSAPGTAQPPAAVARPASARSQQPKRRRRPAGAERPPFERSERVAELAPGTSQPSERSAPDSSPTGQPARRHRHLPEGSRDNPASAVPPSGAPTPLGATPARPRPPTVPAEHDSGARPPRSESIRPALPQPQPVVAAAAAATEAEPSPPVEQQPLVVTIGRVEVRAAPVGPAPAPPSGEAPRRTALTDLDRYLSARGR